MPPQRHLEYEPRLEAYYRLPPAHSSCAPCLEGAACSGHFQCPINVPTNKCLILFALWKGTAEMCKKNLTSFESSDRKNLCNSLETRLLMVVDMSLPLRAFLCSRSGTSFGPLDLPFICIIGKKPGRTSRLYPVSDSSCLVFIQRDPNVIEHIGRNGKG